MPELHLLSPLGFRAGAAHAGLKSTSAPDVGILTCDVLATAAALFTSNKVFAAPVKIGRRYISAGQLRGVIANAGNANACTGRRGEQDAKEMCRLAGAAIGCRPEQILPCSTGIIGHHLPMPKIRKGIVLAAKDLGNSAAHARRFSAAILTTDTRRKTAAARLRVGREWITVAGVCKGSGMIGPRLVAQATLLAYLTTDANVSAGALRQILAEAAEDSFNAVTVDGHTSTNDTLAILASGLGPALDSAPVAKHFAAAVGEVCKSLARQIAQDGEGATKLVEIHVRGARTDADAKLIARAIADSPLVKCAMNGNDPNWGRIVSAAGLCGAAFDPGRAELSLQKTVVFKSGRPMPFNAAAVSRSLAEKRVAVNLNCRLGSSSAIVWTCDLSKDYVTINADYHT